MPLQVDEETKAEMITQIFSIQKILEVHFGAVRLQFINFTTMNVTFVSSRIIKTDAQPDTREARCKYFLNKETGRC